MKRSPIFSSRQFQPSPSCFTAAVSVSMRGGASPTRGAFAEDVKSAAIGTFDTPLFAQVEIDFRVSQGAATAIAGDAVGIDGNDLKRLGHDLSPHAPAHDSRRFPAGHAFRLRPHGRSGRRRGAYAHAHGR